MTMISSFFFIIINKFFTNTTIAHWSCNINFQLTQKVPVIFHNLRGYDNHLIFHELDKFNVKISVTSNGLEKYMAFFLIKT